MNNADFKIAGNYGTCSFRKLKSYTAVTAAMKHNNREIEAGNIEPEFSELNQKIIGDKEEKAKNVTDKVRERVGERSNSERKIRNDAVVAMEICLSASHEYFEGKTPEELQLWVDANVEFLKNEFDKAPDGKSNLIDVTVHLDENTPHIHAIVVPIDERGHLSCKSFTGGRHQIIQMQDRYGKAVKEVGLQRGIRGSGREHMSPRKSFELSKKSSDRVMDEVKDLPAEEKIKEIDRYCEAKLMSTEYEIMNRMDGYKTLSGYQRALETQENNLNYKEGFLEERERVVQENEERIGKNLHKIIQIEDLEKQNNELLLENRELKNQTKSMETKLEKSKELLDYSVEEMDKASAIYQGFAKQMREIGQTQLANQLEHFSKEMEISRDVLVKEAEKSFGEQFITRVKDEITGRTSKALEKAKQVYKDFKERWLDNKEEDKSKEKHSLGIHSDIDKTLEDLTDRGITYTGRSDTLAEVLEDLEREEDEYYERDLY